MTKSITHSTSLPDLISRLHRAMTARMIEALKADGFKDITPAFAAIMPLIDPAESRQSDVARRAGMSKQAVGQLVKELVSRGYLELGRDPADTRATLIRFTERGHALRRRGFELKAMLAGELEQALGARQLKDFTKTAEAALSCFSAAGRREKPIKAD